MNIRLMLIGLLAVMLVVLMTGNISAENFEVTDISYSYLSYYHPYYPNVPYYNSYNHYDYYSGYVNPYTGYSNPYSGYVGYTVSPGYYTPSVYSTYYPAYYRNNITYQSPEVTVNVNWP